MCIRDRFFAPDDSDVERVELVRGPASPMYGPDTQQGVISLFTKSPFNQGHRVSVTVGDRNFMKVYGRYAHQWGSKAATRVSFQHRSFEDWESNMPRSRAEAVLDGHDYFEPELIRRGLQTITYPFIDYSVGGYNDPVTGSVNDATVNEPFKPEATVVETKTVVRPDLKSTLTFNTRNAVVSAIGATGDCSSRSQAAGLAWHRGYGHGREQPCDGRQPTRSRSSADLDEVGARRTGWGTLCFRSSTQLFVFVR